MKYTLTLLLALALVACGDKQQFNYSQPDDIAPVAGDHFMAGVGIRDITPPPGIPRAGYSLWSTNGEGFRTRLYARAYYMKDKSGRAYTMIQTDLMAGSRILLAKVAELVNEKTGLHAGNMTMTATHTHSSPGQFMGSEFYNKHASHKAGFDPVFSEFLAQQIAAAVIEAHDSQVPAKIATGKKEVWGLTRNRSIGPFKENSNHKHVTDKASEVFHQINPYMYMVRLDGQTTNGDYQPLGAFMSFSIHGTSIPRQEPMFSGDLWSYFQDDLKFQIEQQYPTAEKVIVGGFEGTHGDMAPAMPLEQSGYIWSRKVGSALAQHGWQLFQQLEKSLSDDKPVRIAARHVDIRDQPAINSTAICDEAAVGITTIAAPYEHESPVFSWLPFFKTGSKAWFGTDGCQGSRSLVGGSWLQPLFEPKDTFPRDILFQVIQLGDLVIAPLPFELTAETGFRIQNEIQQSYKKNNLSIPDVMVTSLANGYTGYITTPEEYEYQNYEGGHTIYGRYSQPYVTQHLGLLSADLLAQGHVNELPEQWNFNMPVREFIERSEPASKSVREVISEPELTLPSLNKEGYWAFDWRDVKADRIHLHEPLLSIETSTDKENWQPLEIAGRVINDRGYDMSVRLINVGHESARYRASWFNPVFKGNNVWYRFMVQSRENESVLYSAPFN